MDDDLAKELENILQMVVRRMMLAGTHDAAYVRALVNQALDPRWRGEPLKQRQS